MTGLRLVHSTSPGSTGCEAGVTPADRSTLSVGGPEIAWKGDSGIAGDATIELRFGEVSRRIVITIRRPGQTDQVGSGRTIEAAKEFAARMLAEGADG